MKTRRLISRFVFCFFLNVVQTFAQVEYFVKVDPVTSNYSIIDSIPGVQFIALTTSTFDRTNQRYVFKGQDFSGNFFLYSLDALSGQIIVHPQFPSGNQFGNIRVENPSATFYALHYAGSLANTDFISLNPTNFNYSVINTLNLTGLGNDAFIDEINYRYIFVGDDNLGNHCLFTLDCVTGNVISKPIFPSSNSMTAFAIDNSSNSIYCLKWSSMPLATTFGLLNPANLSYTVLDTIRYDLSGGLPLGTGTFDELNQRYTFVGNDANNTSFLYTLDATTGQVIYHPQIPTFTPPCNLIEMKYNNSSGALLALHWGYYSEFSGTKNYFKKEKNINIYPNPTAGSFIIQSEMNLVEIVIYNSLGEVIYKNKKLLSNQSVDLNNQSSGIYFCKVKSADGEEIIKIIKTD